MHHSAIACKTISRVSSQHTPAPDSDRSYKTHRLAKEQVFYIEEKQRQQKRIDAMVAKDPENYDIKKQVNTKFQE